MSSFGLFVSTMFQRYFLEKGISGELCHNNMSHFLIG